MAENNGNFNNNDLDSVLDRLAEEGNRVQRKQNAPVKKPAMRSTSRQAGTDSDPARRPLRSVRDSGQQLNDGVRSRTVGRGSASDESTGRNEKSGSGVKIYEPKSRKANRIPSASDGGNDSRPMKKKKKPVPKPVRCFFTVIAAVICICVLTVGIVGGYVFAYMDKNVSGDIIIDLDAQTANQSKTSIVYAYDSAGELVELTRLHGQENRIWVDLDKIPVNLQNAYIALEDKRFKEHQGVDWIRTIGGVTASHFTQGGSTITQQLIKNLTGENGRTFSRKFNEIIQALNLEKHYSKDSILEAYLNTLYLDACCYGVETAAEYYFGKEVQDLNLAECACIASITKAPRAYNPIINFEENRERQRWCLDEMYAQELITEEEWMQAKDYELVFNTGENKVAVGSLRDDDDDSDNDDTQNEFQSYYTDYVIDALIEDLMTKYDYSYSVAWRQVYYGGLSIYTAVDLDIQNTMEDIYYNRITFSDDEVQSAMTVMDYSGRICGIVGQAGPKPSNRCANYAADFPRQPGSSIKPLSVYAPAINENLITYSSKIKNYGIKEINGRIWPYNYGGDPGSPSSYKTIQQAIAPSLNTVAAQVLEKLTIDTSYDYLTNVFHLSTLTDADADYSPLATGGMTYGTTTLEMAAAYATFGNSGKYYKPYCYYNVKNSKGEVILETDTSQYEQALDPGTADTMNELLQTVVTASNGTGRKFGIDNQVTFAKTGTTTDNNDSWFCGGTPYYVAAVWVGYAESNRELQNIAGNPPSGKIFKAVFDRIHEGLDKIDFEKSDKVVKRAYCYGSGKLASSTCTDTGIGWYKEDNIPGYCTNCGAYGDAASASEASETDISVSDTSVSSSSQTTKPNGEPTAPTTAAPTQPPTTAAPPTVAPPVDPEDER